MELRPVTLPESVPGSLWLGGMPCRFESWTDFEERARHAGLTQVVCLTPLSEVAEISARYDAALRKGDLPFRWINLPMRNFGTPEDREHFQQGVRQIAASLQQGDAVLLHCAAGIGRTGSTAACVLKALGFGKHEALERVREAGSNPQNAQQSGLVDWF